MHNKFLGQHNNNVDELAVHLQSMLDNGASQPTIAKYYNASAAAVHKWIVKLDLRPRRDKLRNDPQWLYDQYHVHMKSTADIAKQLGCTGTAVQQYFTRYNIPIRDNSERSKLASIKTRPWEFLPSEDLKSRGYCIRYKGMWFGSAAEFTYALMLEYKKVEYRHQPFTYNRKRPDFLIDNSVVEIKGGKIPQREYDDYIAWGKQMTAEYGYSYEIINVAHKHKAEYQKVTSLLKQRGAKRGFTFEWVEHNPLSVNDT